MLIGYHYLKLLLMSTCCQAGWKVIEIMTKPNKKKLSCHGKNILRRFSPIALLQLPPNNYSRIPQPQAHFTLTLILLMRNRAVLVAKLNQTMMKWKKETTQPSFICSACVFRLRRNYIKNFYKNGL